MTTLALKPHLLRADTIDLQSAENPSAKDHTRGQYNSGYNHAGQLHTGAHHRQALRNADHDAYHERQTSPRLGEFDHNQGNQQDHMNMYDEDDEDDDDLHHNGVNGNDHGVDYDDDGNDSQDDEMDDELLDKISSSPSIEDEDIDFEFVYALHTFVATVEGQANATKGDTMVLLDDSNSYWWLVRVVKDGSIGYLPAEHIETPTERLARLNKHRNIDLSAAMLGDNPEKTKNPLKKAMRRRNAKTVNFAPPTYYEPEERDWSEEEDGDDDDGGMAALAEQRTVREEQQRAQQAQQSQQHDSGQQIRQVNEITESQTVQPTAATIHRVESNEDLRDDEPGSPVKTNVQAPAPPQAGSPDSAQRSRKGVVRNTDSFFKDESVETRKISLTPHLLRGDSATAAANEQEPKPRVSLDTFDKLVGEDKSKETKKKEKKGMLSGLFKRKDKSAKTNKGDVDEQDRISEDSGRPLQTKESTDTDLGPDRKPVKLQKAPPVMLSPKASPTEARSPQRELSQTSVNTHHTTLGHQRTSSNSNATGPALTLHSSHEQQDQHSSRFHSLQDKLTPITRVLHSKNSGELNDPSVKPVYSRRAKERFAIDDSDSEDDTTPTANSAILHRSVSPLNHNEAAKPRPDSDARVSPIEDETIANGAPVVDAKRSPTTNITQQTNVEASPSSVSDRTISTSKQSPSIPTHTPSTSRSTPTWSDASLRSYMDNDQDIRDLLVIVHDKTNITPVSHEHPLMNGLFATERTKLADMQSQLDTLLLDWISKKHSSTKI